MVTVKEYVSSTLENVIAEIEKEGNYSKALDIAHIRAKEALFWYEQHLAELQKRAAG